MVHGGGEDRFSYAKKHHLNERKVALVAVSDYVRERLLEFGVAPRKVIVIDNFLADRDRAWIPSRPAFAAPTGSRPIEAGRVRVAVVSRLDPIKRIDLLLDAVGDQCSTPSRSRSSAPVSCWTRFAAMHGPAAA